MKTVTPVAKTYLGQIMQGAKLRLCDLDVTVDSAPLDLDQLPPGNYNLTLCCDPTDLDPAKSMLLVPLHSADGVTYYPCGNLVGIVLCGDAEKGGTPAVSVSYPIPLGVKRFIRLHVEASYPRPPYVGSVAAIAIEVN